MTPGKQIAIVILPFAALLTLIGVATEMNTQAKVENALLRVCIEADARGYQLNQCKGVLP